MHYAKFKKNVLKKLVAIAGNKLSTKRMKAEYRKHICAYFYKHMESSRKYTPANKKKLSSGVTKLLKKNSIPETLAAMGAKKEAAAMVAKPKDSAKLAKQAESANKAVKEQERKAAAVVRRVTAAAARVRVENKKNKAAIANEKKVRFRSSKRKSPPSVVAAASKRTRVTRASAAAAKRKLVVLQTKPARKVKGSSLPRYLSLLLKTKTRGGPKGRALPEGSILLSTWGRFRGRGPEGGECCRCVAIAQTR